MPYGWDDLISSLSQPQTSYQGGGIGADYIVNGLVQRGLPRHVAEGFAMNAEDESNFNPGINEAAPTVAGSRGGFGLWQHTGPRRRALEAFAAQRGVSAADPDTQMDFVMYELQGPEKGAFNAIMNTSSSGEAAAAIVNRFERPAEEHRARREAKYLGGSGLSSSVASTPAMDYSRLWLDLGA